MLKKNTLKTLAATTLLTAAVASVPAQAQSGADWPNRPVTIVGGFPIASGVDLYSRKLGQALSEKLGVSFISDARTGAGGNIASGQVARAPADGYTLLLGTAGTHAINAALYQKLDFDVERDFTHIAILGDVPNVILINPTKHPDIKTCRDLIALAKKNPGELNYSSTGNGASTHLTGVLFTRTAGIDLMHVPYRGQGPAMTALLSGEVDVFFNQSAPAIASVRGKQTRALAVTSAKRLTALPDVPTVAEGCGLPGYESSTWYGLFAPAGLPAAIQTRLSNEVKQILSTPDFQSWLVESQGITPPADPGVEAFARIHKADIQRWADIVKASGASVD